MTFDSHLFSYVKSLRCFLTFDSIFVFNLIREFVTLRIRLIYVLFDQVTLCGSTYVVQEEGRFISNVHRISRFGLADHQESPQDRQLVRSIASRGDKILVAQSKASKVENVTAEMLCGRDQQMKKKEDGGLYFVDRGWDSIDRRCKDNNYERDSCIKTFKKALRMRLDMCTAYHPQTDGQTEFSYNDSYHSSIRCALFEALYGRKCRSLVLWAKVKENQLIGLEMVQETTDKVVLIKERLKAAIDHQKSYADNRRKPLEFEVGDQVLQKVSS
nr:putative reverse transcriptase domain-containing protein [Tanacetum cinerariifolium]